MEKDDFSFHAPVYVKGFLANYARFLRLDPGPLVRQFEARIGIEPNEARVLADQNALWSGTVRMPSAFRPLVVMASALLILTTAALWTKAGQDPERPVSNPAGSAPAPDRSDETNRSNDKDRQVAAPAERKDEDVDVRIAASMARSWLEVEVDGRSVFVGMLEHGETRSVRAQRSVRLVLGYPSGVELTVDGRRLGSPGGDDVIEIAIPDDLPELT